LVFNFFLLFFHFADSRKWDFKPLFYGLSGLFTGLLLNPYFPGNLKMGLKHLWIAFEQLKQNDLAYGPELAMQSPLRTLILFTPFFILALFNLLSCWKHRKSEKHKILSLACSLAALSLFVSIRFLEYAPAVILFCLSFTAFSSINLKYIRYSSIAAGLFCLASFNHNRYLENIEYFKKQEVTYKSLLALPPKSENHRIYNCDWWEGQYALWYSKFKVLDVLDPSLLMAQPELFELSYQTKRGRNPNWHTDIREKLDAKYVICNSKRALMDQMLSSDKIVNKSLFRISKNLVLGIFELK
ncbi:MAG: hypothetical protein VX642_05140, partial [Bdellovibrionota bacterium]|nr:hypothetical protein [Bdellovibrionota bacterium]